MHVVQNFYVYWMQNSIHLPVPSEPAHEIQINTLGSCESIPSSPCYKFTKAQKKKIKEYPVG